MSDDEDQAPANEEPPPTPPPPDEKPPHIKMEPVTRGKPPVEERAVGHPSDDDAE